jgi:hypothetical protein
LEPRLALMWDFRLGSTSEIRLAPLSEIESVLQSATVWEMIGSGLPMAIVWDFLLALEAILQSAPLWEIESELPLAPQSEIESVLQSAPVWESDSVLPAMHV